MIITWRVVAIDSSGSRIIIDERLSEERAKEVCDLMVQNGHNAIVEAEIPAEQNGRAGEHPSDSIRWTQDDQTGSHEISVVAD